MCKETYFFVCVLLNELDAAFAVYKYGRWTHWFSPIQVKEITTYEFATTLSDESTWTVSYSSEG